MTQLLAFKKVAPSCQSKPDTWFITYGGEILAPTIRATVGHETLVRFVNKLDTSVSPKFAGHAPCNNGRSGRPFSVHHHGAASLAGFDGRADDEICFGETKDYVYPNNRPATEWYHDHALHVTEDNPYFGSAGLYINSAKQR